MTMCACCQPVREWLSRIDKDAKAARDRRIFDLWLACYTEREIARRENVSPGQIHDICSEFPDLEKTSKPHRAAAEHATDFEPPL
jgi:hypothetical protein